MSQLEKLRTATTLHDLAVLLGFKASALSFIVYKLPLDQKYRQFDIPKRSGGVRSIHAPCPQLRTLQKHLANLLYTCRDQIEADTGQRPLSHGFRRKHSIITNARPHKGRRYVLNLDIENYFPSFNFGRVRGFFIKNHHFALNEKVATVIAQIACHDNMLPQGSPCSPIIADLISHPMDVRLAQFAKVHRLTYTRYADDLTFSTSQKQFPTEVARQDGEAGASWLLGDKLERRIDRAGFAINPGKTRMQVKTTRQLVTGLTVNVKVNIRASYYRHARAMCHQLFKSGTYYRPFDGNEDEPELIDSLNPLEGVLSHIHHVKDSVDRRDAKQKSKAPGAARNLYARFLFYRFFVRLEKPLIVCEGKTDNVYLKYAIRHLGAFQPRMGAWNGSAFDSALSFFSYGNQAHKLLQINGGSGGITQLIRDYQDRMSKYGHRPLLHPVILLIDNDDGAKSVFSIVKEKFKVEIKLDSAKDFYHLAHNLYLVKTPEKGGGGKSCIEDLFEQVLLDTVLDGKKFNPAKETGSDGEYGKHVFAEKVVRPNASTINFSGFAPLLQRVVAVMDHYKPPATHSSGKP